MWKDERSERFAARVADCTSVRELRTLLGTIIAAGLPESDFTIVFGEVIARRLELLKKSGDEVWDRLSG